MAISCGEGGARHRDLAEKKWDVMNGTFMEKNVIFGDLNGFEGDFNGILSGYECNFNGN